MPRNYAIKTRLFSVFEKEDSLISFWKRNVDYSVTLLSVFGPIKAHIKAIQVLMRPHITQTPSLLIIKAVFKGQFNLNDANIVISAYVVNSSTSVARATYLAIAWVKCYEFATNLGHSVMQWNIKPQSGAS